MGWNMDNIAPQGTRYSSPDDEGAGARWRRWLPPVLKPEIGELACLWARTWAEFVLPGGWRVELGGGPVDLAPPPTPLPGTVSVDLNIGEVRVCAEVPNGMLDAALAALGPAALRAATGESRALLLELALEPHLVALEAHLGMEVRITRGPHARGEPGAQAPAGSGAAVALHFACADEGVDGVSRCPARLVAPLETALALAKATAALPADHRRRLPGDLPVPVSIRAAAVDLTRRETTALGPGAVVLPGADCWDRREAVAVAGEAFCWIVAVNGEASGTARIASPGGRAETAGLEKWTMSTHQPTALDVGEDVSLDDLPVRLVFEVGRFEVPLARLQNMGPGFVLPLTPDLERGEVRILANGRSIGRGELVRLGDGGPLGVRVLRMSGYGLEAPPHV
jgi:type III secretion protein Q